MKNHKSHKSLNHMPISYEAKLHSAYPTVAPIFTRLDVELAARVSF